ncbi:hypothetical protein [Alkalibacter mobilis]|nr:hypothetical protein [Alkalibacter mobilis]MBF7095704.1 hypothetical protein [Alkalibacter mobilis]
MDNNKGAPGIYIMNEIFGDEKLSKHKRGNGCGCLVFILIIILLMVLF